MTTKRLFYLVTYFITHLIFAQSYEDTLEVYDESKYFDECSDSLEKVYHVHFKPKYGHHDLVVTNSVYIQKVKKFIDKYGEEKYNRIVNGFEQCVNDKIYNFYLYDCRIDTTNISQDILSYEKNGLLPHFEHNDTIISDFFKCTISRLFTEVKMIHNRPNNDYNRMTIEISSHSSTIEKKGCSLKRLMDLKQYFEEHEMLKLEHVKFDFKDYGSDTPNVPNRTTHANRNNRIEIKVISIE